MLYPKCSTATPPTRYSMPISIFIADIGLAENLSPTRSNGLLAMIKQMRAYALAFKGPRLDPPSIPIYLSHF